jgi:hypothetical protein
VSSEGTGAGASFNIRTDGKWRTDGNFPPTPAYGQKTGRPTRAYALPPELPSVGVLPSVYRRENERTAEESCRPLCRPFEGPRASGPGAPARSTCLTDGRTDSWTRGAVRRIGVHVARSGWGAS